MFTTTKQCVDGRSVILIYGQSGLGKTTLIGTLPDPTRVLIVNADNGLKSLENLEHDIPVYDLTKKKKRNPDKTIFKDKKGMEVLEEMPREKRFPKLTNFLKTQASNEDFKDAFDWIVFDDITEIFTLLLEYVESLDEYQEEKMALKMWGAYDKSGTAFVKALRDFAPYNILLLGLDAIDKDKEGRRFIGLDIAGKVSRRIPALVDEVFYLNIVKNKDKKEVRKLITAPHKNCVAKDRSGKLSKFENPHLGDILKKMNGSKESK